MQREGKGANGVHLSNSLDRDWSLLSRIEWQGCIISAPGDRRVVSNLNLAWCHCRHSIANRNVYLGSVRCLQCGESVAASNIRLCCQ